MQTGVKSLGCENSTAQPSPIQSWNRIGPSVVSASKSGASSPMRRVICLSPRNLDQVSGDSILVAVEQWGEDPKLVALLGEQGAAGFRALFDGFPELVGVLWALRGRRRADRGLRLRLRQPGDHARLPHPARDPRALHAAGGAPAHARQPRVRRVRAHLRPTASPGSRRSPTTRPFGDGYMLGTFAHRVTKLGDGVMVFLTDITEQRRMEADLRGYADVVAHDLREPVANMALLVRLLERGADDPPRADVLEMLRDGIGRTQELIEAVLAYARMGELSPERVRSGRADGAGRRRPALEPGRRRRDARGRRAARGALRPAPAQPRAPEPGRQRREVPRRRAAPRRGDRRSGAARSGS